MDRHLQFSGRGLMTATGIVGAASAFLFFNLTECALAAKGKVPHDVHFRFAATWAIVFFSSFGGVVLAKDGLVQLVGVLLGFVGLVAGVVNFAIWCLHMPSP